MTWTLLMMGPRLLTTILSGIVQIKRRKNSTKVDQQLTQLTLLKTRNSFLSTWFSLEEERFKDPNWITISMKYQALHQQEVTSLLLIFPNRSRQQSSGMSIFLLKGKKGFSPWMILQMTSYIITMVWFSSTG